MSSIRKTNPEQVRLIGKGGSSLIDESDLKALNKLLAQTEPSSNIFNYLLFRGTNQFKPIAKLLHEASLWFVLFLLSTTALTILAIMASLYELSSMRSTIFVLLLVIDCVIFLISISRC